MIPMYPRCRKLAATHSPGKQIRCGPAPPDSLTEGSSECEEATLAALSGLRLSTSRRASGPASQPLAGSSLDTISVATPSPPHYPSSPTNLSRPVVTKVSHVDLLGEDSSDSDGLISLSDAPVASVNQVLPIADYCSLPRFKVSRNKWIPG